MNIPTPLDIVLSRKLLMYVLAHFIALFAVAVTASAIIHVGAYTLDEFVESEDMGFLLVTTLVAVIVLPTAYESLRIKYAEPMWPVTNKIIAYMLSVGAALAVVSMLALVVCGMVAVLEKLGVPQAFAHMFPIFSPLVSAYGITTMLFLVMVVLVIYAIYLEWWLYEKWRTRL